ncbi:MAG: hypothetical protein KatS3mg113_0653 [Planctomycetaceae bacterium]|nr:MAG: hypothetical protein KatS3mg113_0653 [Planctomycetaceae bacterium]
MRYHHRHYWVARPAAVRPAAAYRQRTTRDQRQAPFGPSETWYDPDQIPRLKIIVQPPGEGYWHPLTPQMIRDRLAQLPTEFAQAVKVVQLCQMTRKRALFPCYGMQWGQAVYLYPIEASLIETYLAPPRPQQVIEARMFGGRWIQQGKHWKLLWTEQSIRDFYLHNVLIHEVGHVLDQRNTNQTERERFANWFAIEYGYRRHAEDRGENAPARGKIPSRGVIKCSC